MSTVSLASTPSGPAPISNQNGLFVVAALIILGFGLVAFSISQSKHDAPPAPQPLPVAQPAKCGPGCDCKVKPFNVYCPYCRNVIQVQPPTGNTGAIGSVLKR